MENIVELRRALLEDNLVKLEKYCEKLDRKYQQEKDLSARREVDLVREEIAEVQAKLNSLNF